MPFPIYFGRTVMPDTWMLLAAILAIWTFQRWLERPSARRYTVALLCGVLAPLAKTPNLLIVAVPLAYLTWTARPPRRDWPAVAGYAVCFALPSLLWLNYARTLPLDGARPCALREERPDGTDLAGVTAGQSVLTGCELPLPSPQCDNKMPWSRATGPQALFRGRDADTDWRVRAACDGVYGPQGRRRL
jgi:hypothetical protein